MKRLCVILMAVCMLAGCSGGKEKKVICKEEYDGDVYVYEFYATGDTMNSHTIKVDADLKVWELDEEDLSEENIESTKEMLDEYYMDIYMGLKGIKTTSAIDENKTKYTATIEIDFSQVDFKELEKADLVENGTQEISLEMTLEDYSNCTETEL